MIIDVILDRYDYEEYNPKDLYMSARRDGYEDVSRAMDYDGNEEIVDALCNYIVENGYNPTLCEYIKGCDWLLDHMGYLPF